MADRRPTCRTYEVDEKPVVARSVRPLTEKDLAALAEFQELLRRQASVRAAIEQKQVGDGESDASIDNR